MSVSLSLCQTTKFADPGEVLLLAKISPETGARVPLDVSLVIDVSGSMADRASLKTEVEDNGLSILDITKHAVKTIIKILGPNDRLGIVSFSGNATIELPLTTMTEDGAKAANTALDKLRPTGSTNLWAGLIQGLDVLRESSRDGHMASVLLLTDGVPNVQPPDASYKVGLQKYKEKHETLSAIVNTFGFGYNLNSEILSEIADECDGSFAFIPDSGMVGTCFVNAATNLNATLSLELNDGATAEVVGPYRTLATSWGKQVQIGQLQYGQSRDILFRVKIPSGKSISDLSQLVSATINYTGVDDKAQSADADSNIPESVEAEIHRHRLALVELVLAAVAKGQAESSIVPPLLTQIKQTPEDVEGQVAEALSSAQFYQKWGRHYLRSLARAHFLQQCNNFKDPGVQHYGGTVFQELRDIADDIFLSLPPPTPTAPPRSSYGSSSSSVASYAPVQMSGYYASSAPCFAGHCQVLLADGSLKAVSELSRGDTVTTPNGSATVRCVLETRQSRPIPMVTLKGLQVTAWHPVQHDGNWAFPSSIGTPQVTDLPAVYSFLLDQDHAMIIGEQTCITLGHGIENDPVATHSYFGTDRVVADLQAMKGWKSGRVVLGDNCTIRDAKTGLVSALDKCAEIIN